MDMNQAAVFLAGSILTMIGFIVIVVGLVIINNVIHRYWKPIKMWKFEAYPPHYMNQEPAVEQVKEKETKK